jgi:putative protease
MRETEKIASPPSIMAPAGNKAAFLAAVAAGADAIYCGLKLFSARMEAKNFSLEELQPLVELAHARGIRVHVTLNSLLKPGDLDVAGKFIKELAHQVRPDGLIIQDLAAIPLVRQAGFSGEIHLSTLTNVSFAKALMLVRHKLRVDRVVLPRELTIDEIKTVAQAIPPDLKLEVFIHGALCYAVSGRCYWSSYLGGKSGLRGRCVQPCRRIYHQNDRSHRFFSCQDLSIDVLVKVLLTVPQVRTWKIEGRKKGPHYVYYTVQAYRMLRDHGGDPQLKKNALQMLSRALGRTGTHYYFLPQRLQNPISADGQTGSGFLIGKIKGSRQKPFVVPREALLPGDVLRTGYEDEPSHRVEKIGRHVPKGGKFYFRPKPQKRLAKGTPVYLIDRREESLNEILSRLDKNLSPSPHGKSRSSNFKAKLPERIRRKEKAIELPVYRRPNKTISGSHFGLWLSAEGLQFASSQQGRNIWWWLPPVIWPQDESACGLLLAQAFKMGARNFVLNAVWQASFFKDRQRLNLWAGPFCNLANALALKTAASFGLRGAVLSPELGRQDYLTLASQRPLALGLIISGNWPLCVARTKSRQLQLREPFSSPKGEQAWITQYGTDFWVFPNWKLDLREHKQELREAGYSLFVHLSEPLPKAVKLKKRPGKWNWDVNLK